MSSDLTMDQNSDIWVIVQQSLVVTMAMTDQAEKLKEFFCHANVDAARGKEMFSKYWDSIKEKAIDFCISQYKSDPKLKPKTISDRSNKSNVRQESDKDYNKRLRGKAGRAVLKTYKYLHDSMWPEQDEKDYVIFLQIIIKHR